MAARTSIPLKRSRSTLGLRPPGCRDPHYDGARADAAKPAVIAVSKMRPVRQKWVGQRFLPRRHKIPGPPAAQITQIRAIIGNGVTTKAAVPNGGSARALSHIGSDAM